MKNNSDYKILEKHKKIWSEKKILRELYYNWYTSIISYLSSPNKNNLELGSGSGNFKEYYKNIITSDIILCPWINVCFDAHYLPFKQKSLDNIIMFDVLHHFSNPVLFLKNAHKTLKKNGRIIILEPYSSLFSGLIYNNFHKEPFDFTQDFFNQDQETIDYKKNAFSANQAAAQLLFYKKEYAFKKIFNGQYNIIKKELLSYIAYPLSGGFDNKALLPDFFIRMLMKFEKYLSFLKKILAFRTLIVLEKNE